MATPTKSQAVSTPKNPLAATPNRPMASPRPATSGTAQKSLAYKSPAVKTPASVHSHVHYMSASSQPSSTPMAATAIHDELLALNSPAAALIASIAPTGLTPLSSGQDGLGISTHLPLSQGRDVRNPETDRLTRIQQVATLLKTRAATCCITREGVERIAQLQGFETIWDESNLNVAGSAVDLEIIFDPIDKDTVRDVVLNVNPTATGEPQLRKDGTQILKDDLTAQQANGLTGPWNTLEAFSANLRRLRQLDHVDSTTNCFEVIGGLYEAFQKIWDEEKSHLQWRNKLHHLCYGSVGRPGMDRKPRLGFSLNYWADKHEDFQTTNQIHGEDHPAEDEVEDSRLWTAQFYCEAGNFSIPVSKDWLAAEVLSKEVPENLLDSTIESLKPKWRDPIADAATSQLQAKDDTDTIMMDPPNAIPQMLNLHFVCSLDPEVLLPVNVAASLNTEINMIEIDQGAAMTYQQALQMYRNAKAVTAMEKQIERRWHRPVPVVNGSGKVEFHEHSYALYSATNGTELWCLQVKELKLTHPKQFANAVQLMRQYALLWTLLKNLVEPASKSGHVQEEKTEIKFSSKKIMKRSNTKKWPQKKDLSSALQDVDNPHDLAIDFSLDLVSDGSKPRLNLFVPLVGATKGRQANNPFVSISIVINSACKIEIETTSGITFLEQDKLKLKLARMLTRTEDIGIIIEWILLHEKSGQ